MQIRRSLARWRARALPLASILASAAGAIHPDVVIARSAAEHLEWRQLERAARPTSGALFDSRRRQFLVVTRDRVLRRSLEQGDPWTQEPASGGSEEDFGWYDAAFDSLRDRVVATEESTVHSGFRILDLVPSNAWRTIRTGVRPNTNYRSPYLLLDGVRDEMNVWGGFDCIGPSCSFMDQIWRVRLQAGATWTRLHETTPLVRAGHFVGVDWEPTTRTLHVFGADSTTPDGTPVRLHWSTWDAAANRFSRRVITSWPTEVLIHQYSKLVVEPGGRRAQVFQITPAPARNRLWSVDLGTEVSISEVPLQADPHGEPPFNIAPLLEDHASGHVYQFAAELAAPAIHRLDTRRGEWAWVDSLPRARPSIAANTTWFDAASGRVSALSQQGSGTYRFVQRHEQGAITWWTEEPVLVRGSAPTSFLHATYDSRWARVRLVDSMLRLWDLVLTPQPELIPVPIPAWGHAAQPFAFYYDARRSRWIGFARSLGHGAWDIAQTLDMSDPVAWRALPMSGRAPWCTTELRWFSRSGRDRVVVRGGAGLPTQFSDPRWGPYPRDSFSVATLSDSLIEWVGHASVDAPDGTSGYRLASASSSLWDASGRYLFTPTASTSAASRMLRTDIDSLRVAVEPVALEVPGQQSSWITVFDPGAGAWRFISPSDWEVRAGETPLELTMEVAAPQAITVGERFEIEIGIQRPSPGWVRLNLLGAGGVWRADTVCWAPTTVRLPVMLAGSEQGGTRQATLTATVLEDIRVATSQAIALELRPAVIHATAGAPRLEIDVPSPARSASRLRIRSGADQPIELDLWDAQGRRISRWTRDVRAGESFEEPWPQRDRSGPGVRFLRVRQGDQVLSRRIVRLD